MNKTVLYLQCESGISGDMTVAALLDLGADRQVLEKALASLPLTGYSIEIKDVFKSGIRACDFHVILEHDNHDHDMEYLHGVAGHAPGNVPHTHIEYMPENVLHTHTEHMPENALHTHAEHMPENVLHTHAEHMPENVLHTHDAHICSDHIQESAASMHSDHVHKHTHDDHMHSDGVYIHSLYMHEHPDHDHTHSDHVHEHPDHSGHVHEHLDHDHTHSDHMHEHPDHSHAHNARNLHDITEIISVGQLTENARALAIRIFQILAEAEASVHGKHIDEVHFHEVGAVDSIIDIVAAAVCIDNLHPDSVVISTLVDGCGQIRCQHGLIPVPVPAVSAIAAAHHLKLKITEVQGELVTPTGAAVAAALQSGETLPDEFCIQKTGFGAGKRDYPTTGLLRAMLISAAQSTDANSVSVPANDTGDCILSLETNIDDCSGEALAYTMQQLMGHGALDVFYIPIYMKKNRPAYLLKVLCNVNQRAELESIIFRNTTTIGIRVHEVQRTRLDRKILAVETPWGMADVKCCNHGSEVYYYPENDSVCRLAEANHIGFPEMYHMIQEYVRQS